MRLTNKVRKDALIPIAAPRPAASPHVADAHHESRFAQHPQDLPVEFCEAWNLRVFVLPQVTAGASARQTHQYDVFAIYLLVLLVNAMLRNLSANSTGAQP
ncbi:MAG: hypothetical protein ABIO49_03095 [Dokdonella sp.]